MARKMYGVSISKLPEHDCPECDALAGQWCIILPGAVGWQHDSRPLSSWEPTKRRMG